MNKKELNNVIFESMLKHAAHEEVLKLAAEMQSPEGIEAEHHFSEEFEKKMQKLLKKENNRERNRRTKKVFSKIAVGLVIFIVLSAAIVFSAEALRVKFLNFISDIGEKSADIEFIDNNAVDEKAYEDSGMYLPTYMPIGYELQSIQTSPNYNSAIYKNRIGKVILINQYSDLNGIKMDSEDIIYKNIDSVIIEGNYFSKNENTMLFFILDEYGFMINGKVTIDELVMIAESIRK